MRHIAVSYEKYISGKIQRKKKFSYVSLFSGAGIGDFGLKMAGGRCLAACEIDPMRAKVHYTNIKAPLFKNICEDKYKIIEYLSGTPIDLLFVTPPCQSFSTANAKRGFRDDPDHATRDTRNLLFFEALEVAKSLKPKFIIFENVPNFLYKKVKNPDAPIIASVIDFIKGALNNYTGLEATLCFSEYGIPQKRIRSIAVFSRNDLGNEVALHLNQCLSKSPKFKKLIKNHPSTVMEAIGHLEPLDSYDAMSAQSLTDIYHQVPVTQGIRYQWIYHIPPNSGKSALNNACEHCGFNSTPRFNVKCQNCGIWIKNRPHVENEQGIRSIKGFKTSYRRMMPDQPAPTITTNTNSFSSDTKIHPSQHRVLSVRECALLQSIPYSFRWPEEAHYKTKHLIREMIGEAVPPAVTFHFGTIISSLISS